MKKSADQKVPAHLDAPTRKWWESVVAEYVLEPHHVRLLTGAAESWDRSQEARKLVSAEGIIVRDRFGQLKEHPAVRIERDSRLAFARLLRELGLDVAPPAENRPPTVAGRAGLRMEK